MNYTEQEIWQLLEQVSDPEVPVLSVIDLGIVRKIEIIENKVFIDITPTYTGCPAMSAIEMGIKFLMIEKGIECKINLVLSPAWTTAWMSEKGKAKLKAYGIAPPQYEIEENDELFSTPKGIICPRCESINTLLVSQFGSTACKSLFKCLDCLEPFDYFKCHK